MKILISIVFFALMASCNGSKNTTKEENVSDHEGKGETHEIVGRWKLYKTECCGRNKSTRMAEDTEEESRYMKFESDGMVKYQDHGTLLKKVPYHFETTKEGDQDWIKIGDEPTAIYVIKGDTLMLNWEYMDLQIEYYLKH